MIFFAIVGCMADGVSDGGWLLYCDIYCVGGSSGSSGCCLVLPTLTGGLRCGGIGAIRAG